MNVACDYEAPMQMLTTETYIASGHAMYFNISYLICLLKSVRNEVDLKSWPIKGLIMIILQGLDIIFVFE